MASWTEQRVESALPFLLLHLDLDWIQGLIGGEGGAGPEATWGIGWTGVGTFSASVEEKGLRVSMQLQWEESEAVGTAALSR